MERLRAQLANNPALYPHIPKKPQGSKHSPLTIFDSDDEDDAPANPGPPLQIDRSNDPVILSSRNTMIPSAPAAAIPPRTMQMPVPHPAAPARLPMPGPSAAPAAIISEGGETFNLGNIVADPLEYRKTADAAQKELVDLIQSSFDADLDVDMEQAIVEGFAEDIKLLPHQVQGRLWMTERETGKKQGGILGDMGLGKTIQTLNRIVDSKLSGDERTMAARKKWGKTTLVICPAGVMAQWESEIKKMAPILRVHIHHGPSREKDPDRLARYDVVITSYPTVTAEHKNVVGAHAKDESKGKSKKGQDDDDDEEAEEDFDKKYQKGKAKRVVKKHTALFDKSWLRIVLDEAHTIKNRTAKGSLACYDLKALFRWALTGTPIQNSVEELFSLFHFLHIRPLNDWDTFRAQIANPIKQGKSGVPMKRLQVVLQAIMLRRTKTQIINGKPILNLPDRSVAVVECEFDEEEQQFYTAVVDRTELTLNKYAKSGTLNNNFTSVLILLLRLRQACCHPDLCTAKATEDVDAIDPKVKGKDQDETEDAADELADLLGGLTVKETFCEICRDRLEPGVKSQYCPDCELQVVIKARRKSVAKDDDDLSPLSSSAKIRKLLEVLEKIETDSEGDDKTIVFSQFTKFLDIIEKFLRKAGRKFVRYDGSMKVDERTAALDKFRTSKRYNVALISFKAGSVGLNLTAANHVVLMDLWWNPALEDQAFDRAHRLGQKKNVHIHKLVIPKTVEERIQALQDKKRELATSALTGDKLGKNSRLKMDELMKLFSHDYS